MTSLWPLKVKTQCFSEKFRKKKFFLIFLSLSKRFFLGIFACFEILIGMPKFKENVIICVITVIKVRDLLLTFLLVITILAT